MHVSLAFEPGRAAFAGRAASFQALAPLAAEHSELAPRDDYYAPASRAALAHLERRLFELGSARIDPAAAVRLLEGGGERAELELVAGEITRAAGRGIAPEEIAIVARARRGLADLLEEVFADAGIPFALQRPQPLSATARVGSALIGLLRCVPGPPTGAPAGTCWRGCARPGCSSVPSSRTSWSSRVRRTGTQERSRQHARCGRSADWPLDTIDRDARQRSSAGPAGPDRRGRRASSTALFLRTQARARSDPRRAASSTRHARSRPRAPPWPSFASSRGALRSSRPRSASELARVLEHVRVRQRRRARHREPSPSSTRSALRARRVRALFLCGLQEGVFPARARPQPLLSEEQRLRLARGLRSAPRRARDDAAGSRALPALCRGARGPRSCST